MRVLLVWQEVPDSISFVVLDNPSDDDLAVLQTASGAYMGSHRSDEQELALEKINLAMGDPERSAGTTDPELTPWNARWFTGLVPEESLPTIGQIDKVFTCGVLL
jgi:hypothetical protein